MRALRRHHLQRIRRKVLKQIKQRHRSYQTTWKFIDRDGETYEQHYLIPDWREKEAQYLHKRTYKEASHRPHFCQMCKRPRYNRRKDLPPMEEE